jgi:hypothetical protein
MTPIENRENIQKLLPEIGLKAELFTSIQTGSIHEKLYTASLYPLGISARSEEGYLRVNADTLAELWDQVHSGWLAHRERHRQQITRKMALAIIQITADFGECTDAALRTAFAPSEIKSYGTEACAAANAMAACGPFSIKAMVGANAAA